MVLRPLLSRQTSARCQTATAVCGARNRSSAATFALTRTDTLAGLEIDQAHPLSHSPAPRPSTPASTSHGDQLPAMAPPAPCAAPSRNKPGRRGAVLLKAARLSIPGAAQQPSDSVSAPPRPTAGARRHSLTRAHVRATRRAGSARAPGWPAAGGDGGGCAVQRAASGMLRQVDFPEAAVQFAGSGCTVQYATIHRSPAPEERHVATRTVQHTAQPALGTVVYCTARDGAAPRRMHGESAPRLGARHARRRWV